MAIKPGYKRLPDFDYLIELSEEARETLDIPENAKGVNITDNFCNGGPIVISSSLPTTEEQREDNKKRLQYAIDAAFEAIIANCENNQVSCTNLNNQVGALAEIA